MICPRCGGMMAAAHFPEIRDKNGEGTDGLKCLLCGEILDAVILENRSKEKAPLPTRPPSHARWIRA